MRDAIDVITDFTVGDQIDFKAVDGDILSFNLTIPNFDNATLDLIFILVNSNLTTFSSSSSFNSGALLA